MIEGILWFPLMVLLLIMVMDASIVFMNKARIERVVQDGQRAFAVGSISDCDALETWIESNLSQLAPSAVAVCVTDLSLTRTRVAIPVDELDLSGGAGFLGGLTVNVESIHMSERGNEA